MEEPKAAGRAPKMENLVEGKNYAWCACGKSDNQPWCNGAHKGSDLAPKVFKAEASNNAAMCMCKQTKNPPYCDGSHASM
jgi:CDGSH-type Zn-finger protein